MIKKHYRQLKQSICDTTLCIVSKQRSVEEIQSYYAAGERIFAENRAGELIMKAASLPSDIQWQYIGHLQRNKVKEILPIVSCIQSLDNFPLAKVIEKEAEKINREIAGLIELHLADEDKNKTGLHANDAESFTKWIFENCPHILLQGIMVMGPHTDNPRRIHQVFKKAEDIFYQLQNQFGHQHFHVLSMGMSDDYPIALQHGSTMVRIGSYLFKEKNEL